MNVQHWCEQFYSSVPISLWYFVYLFEGFFLPLLTPVKCRQTLRGKKKSMSFHLKFVVFGQAGSKQDSIIRLSNPYSGLIFNL